MIKVDRPPTPPSILRQKAAVWLQKLQAAQTPREFQLAQERYSHSEIKRALVDVFHGKCAYCESHITHVDYGDIEHYRPKSRWKDLTFEWSNLLLACGVCNGSGHKSDHFPEPAEGGPIINPCLDEPNEHFDFHYDPIAMLANVRPRTTRGQVTEQLLGLNRAELRKQRSKYFQKLLVLAQLSATSPEAERLLREAKQAEAEYAAFARTL